MANTNPTANMNLPVPVIGVDPGPDWASNVNACFTILDSHNHASGSGVQINPSGINIDSDFLMNSNNLTLVRTIRYNSQSAPLALASDLNCTYTSGVDLYYNDGNGNQVRMTQNGAVAGTPGSIANLSSPASASYVSANQTFVWQSDASTPANLDAASVIFRNLTTNSNGITVSAPNALASNYDLTLPTLPGQTNVMTLSSTGIISSITYDATAQNMTSVGANAIGTTMTATGANAVAASRTRSTGSSVGIGGVAISSSSGMFTTTSATPVQVTNLSVSITTSGRPVYITLNNASTSGCYVWASPLNTAASFIYFYRAGSNMSTSTVNYSSGVSNLTHPLGAFHYIDTPSAGTYTYAVFASADSGSSIQVNNALLVVYEL